MIEYRRKEEKDKETFVLFGTDVIHEPGFQGFTFNLFEPPKFLATTTRRCFDSIVLYPHFSVDNDIIDQLWYCTDGWEKTTKEEYDKALNEALSYFHR